ncbi:MAG: PilZ domain-containing protein [Sulfuricella sp.]|nr:PilZ domain-containing protein [Sulfuricella sp.]
MSDDKPSIESLVSSLLESSKEKKQEDKQTEKQEKKADAAPKKAAFQPKKPDVSERREYTRFHAKWRVAIVHRNPDGENIHHGVTKDISMGGVSILLENNLYISDLITVLIQIPNQSFKGGSRVLEVKCRMVMTVYDGSARKFRAGVEFKEFVKKDDRVFLESHLANNKHPIP